MTERIFDKILSRNGVEPFDPLGEQFDPALHDAMYEIQNPQKATGTVDVVEKIGYTFHDAVLRPAMVGVIRNMSK